MDAFLHQFLSGVATGGIYASMGLALVMIFQATHHINFAQGEQAMFSAYVALILIHAGVPYWAAFAIALAFAFVSGVAIERIVVRPFNDAPVLSVVVVFLGMLFIINSLAGWLFTFNVQAFPSPFPQGLGNRFLSGHEIGMLIMTLGTLALVFVFFRYTSLGLAMRAAAQNPEASRLVGIRVGWMLALGWGLAGAVGAIAAIMAAPIVFIEPNMMAGTLLYGFAAALLGGINNPWGAVVGGFIVGVIENLAGAYVVGTELKLSIALIIIIGVLVMRPAGLFGTPVVTRV
jgi:branched-chain amino acid transport system permease protein